MWTGSGARGRAIAGLPMNRYTLPRLPGMPSVERAGSGCSSSAPRKLSGFLPGVTLNAGSDFDAAAGGEARPRAASNRDDGFMPPPRRSARRSKPRPASFGQAPNAVAAGCTTRFENAHRTVLSVGSISASSVVRARGLPSHHDRQDRRCRIPMLNRRLGCRALARDPRLDARSRRVCGRRTVFKRAVR